MPRSTSSSSSSFLLKCLGALATMALAIGVAAVTFSFFPVLSIILAIGICCCLLPFCYSPGVYVSSPSYGYEYGGIRPLVTPVCPPWYATPRFFGGTTARVYTPSYPSSYGGHNHQHGHGGSGGGPGAFGGGHHHGHR